MSSGDIDNVEYSDERWADFRGNNPRLLMLLSIPPQFNDQYDIPYLGGLSTDARVIYLHRLYRWMWGGVDTRPFIGVHEITEWYCMVHLGLSYVQGHRWANTAEDHAVFMAGYDHVAYNKFIDREVPKIEAAPVTMVPRDLFLGPYLTQDTKPGLLAAIKAAQR